MSVEISKFISNDEILVRFIFKSDFKKKIVSTKKINFSNFMQPHKGGVSLQRELFCNEDESKFRVKKINTNLYVGFYVFRKREFDLIKEHYLLSNTEFKAEIFATPLNKENEYLPLPINSDTFTNNSENPSHADIVYINPSPKEGETPKTAIRSFVKKLFKESNLIIDNNPEDLLFTDCKFSDIV